MYFLAVFSFGLAGRPGRAPIDVSRPHVHAAGDDRRRWRAGRCSMAPRPWRSCGWQRGFLARVAVPESTVPVDLAGAAGRVASRLDAGADVDAVRLARAAHDRRRAVAGHDRRRRSRGARVQGPRAPDGRHPGAAASPRVSRRPLRRRARPPRRRARLAASRSPGSDGSRMSCSRGARPLSRRPRALKRGSSGGGMAGRCRRWSGILLPFELALLFVVRDTPAIVFDDASRRAAHAALHGRSSRATVGRSNHPGRDNSYGVTPFIADAAADQRRARRRQAEDGDLEHARRVAAGPRRRPARAQTGRALRRWWSNGHVS